MQPLEVSGAERPIYGSLGVKRLIHLFLCRSVTPCLSNQKNDIHVLQRLNKTVIFVNVGTPR